jgi:ribonuclease P protein subunit POP4
MIITPDIIRAEFIGAKGTISNSRHAQYVGISGQVIDETKNTFTINHQGKMKNIVKATSVFQFQLSDKSTVEIDGKLLVGKPEDRLKKVVKRLW